MATIRDQILDAIVSTLSAGKPVGLAIERFPGSNIPESFLPHCSIRPGRETVERPADKLRAYPVRSRRLEVRLEFRAKGAGGSSPDKALDPLLAHATRALAVNPTLGGLALESEEVETEWDVEDVDISAGLATVLFLVRYTTNSGDQEKAK